MDRRLLALRLTTITALAAAALFLLLPAAPPAAASGAVALDTAAVATPAPTANADSLAEDVILHNLFSPSRAAPDRRVVSSGDTASGMSSTDMTPNAGFQPVLAGTAISERPGDTRALLQLDPADPAPRLYAVGDQAGGYRVVSIEAREVVIAGPRGRLVLRLPQRQEENP